MKHQDLINKMTLEEKAPMPVSAAEAVRRSARS